MFYFLIFSSRAHEEIENVYSPDCSKQIWLGFRVPKKKIMKNGVNIDRYF